jgi:dihydrofolate reductase
MELVVTENITLDGVIDVTGGWFDPTTDEEVDESDVLATVQAEMARQDALLLGRVTFEEFRGFWPQQADDTTGISAHLAAVRKLVASRTLGFDPGWERTTVLRGPLEQEVERLKARPGGVLGVTGSVSVVRQLIAAGPSTCAGCTSTRSSWAAGRGSSRTRPPSGGCGWSRPRRSATAWSS